MTAKNNPPSRLHHNAYVVKDLEKTRAFYEHIIGMPFWRFYGNTDQRRSKNESGKLPA